MSCENCNFWFISQEIKEAMIEFTEKVISAFDIQGRHVGGEILSNCHLTSDLIRDVNGIKKKKLIVVDEDTDNHKG